MLIQGKHRYYSLQGANVASVLEGLSVLAGVPRETFVPNTPSRLRAARTCYDHIAGTLGVALHDRFKTLNWFLESNDSFDMTSQGAQALASLGIDIDAARALRRRFAFPCLDWSERRPHIGGAVGAEILKLALQKKWVSQHLDSRALAVTKFGRRELLTHFGISLT